MNRIKELRIEAGLHQQQLADEIGYKQRNISDWERERTEPNIDAIFKMANFFECSIDYLLNRSNELDQVIITKNISKDEEEILAIYRKLQPQTQSRLIGYGIALAEQQKSK
ncbi:MAG: helix-turn-helix transcriptional regulator [Clostridia bacterium]